MLLKFFLKHKKTNKYDLNKHPLRKIIYVENTYYYTWLELTLQGDFKTIK